jgi:hypothetical protein
MADDVNVTQGSNRLDDNIIQKLLFVNADKIFEKVFNDQSLSITPKSKILSSSTFATNKSFNKEESAKLISRQHELVSAAMAPTKESAKELFQDPQTQNFFINSGYTISHNLVLTKNKKKYIFNIDEINRIANKNPDGFGGRFVIHKVNIVNRSKDAFTSKSNFQITLHIAFSFFDDLKDEIIPAVNLNNPSEKENFSLLNLVYPLYRKGYNPNTNSKTKEIKDGNGIILNQVLDMAPGANKYFKQTKAALGGATEIHKNYHLTFFKHSINLFKSSEATLKPFDSELIIDFIAYEADPQPNTNRDDNTPTNSNNLYTLLLEQRFTNSIGSQTLSLVGDTRLEKPNTKGKLEWGVDRRSESLFKVFSDSISVLNQLINNLERAINCKETGKEIYTTLGIIDLSGVKTVLSKEKFIEEANSKINSLKENLSKLREEFSVNLFRLIINKLDIFEFKINSSSIVSYQSAATLESFLRNFSGNVQGFGTAATVVAAATGGAALPALIGGALVAGVVSGFQASAEEGTVIPKDGIGSLRQAFNPDTIQIIKQSGDNYAGLIAGRLEEVRREVRRTPRNMQQREFLDQEDVADQKAKRESTKAETSIVDQSLKILDESQRKISEQGQNINVRFILFGQLIDLLPKSNDTTIIFGGKTIPIGPDSSAYLNYYYLPIDYYKLLKFLNEKICKRDNYNYNTEVFTKELVETFLKESIIQDGVVPSAIKEIIPTHVITNVHLVDGENESYNNFISSVSEDILDDERFEYIKRNFILCKNLSAKSSATKKLKKIYTITADEDIKNYNFYAGYSDWKSANKKPSTNTSATFQEFIIDKYSMPCLRTKAVDTYGSILINKNLSFSRKDNQNLTTGQILDNSAIFRLPYDVTGQFKPYIFFFMDVSSFMFVAPPDSRNATIDIVDTFGYSGLYLVKNSSFEYNFQLLDNNNAPIFPNEKSKCELVGQLITYGDGLAAQQKQTTENKTICTDPQPVSDEPSASE